MWSYAMNSIVPYKSNGYAPSVVIGDDLDRLFLRVFGTVSYDDVNSTVKDDRLVIDLDVPGVSADSVEIQTARNNTLQVSWKRKKSSYTKTIYVQDDFDLASCDALLENGVLTMTFQKRESAKSKKIVVKSK